MVRRRGVICAVVGAVLALLAAPALAYVPTVSYPVPAGTRLAAGAADATYLWPASGGTALEAARVPLGAASADGPYAVVSGITAPRGEWFACGDGSSVDVIWKDADTVFVERYDLAAGARAFAPVAVCSDAQAAALCGAPGAAVSPAGISADGRGGAYVWCTVSPAPDGGCTLLNYVDATGTPATTSPTMKVVARPVVALESDAAGHAWVLLADGSGAAVERLGPGLSSDWGGARSPYLLPPTPRPAAETALDLVVAGDDVFALWREGGVVKVQRFDAAGGRLWLAPPAVTMPGAVALAGDGSGGAYIVGPLGDGVVARHILATGREAAWSPSALTGLGLARPRVDAVAGNRAGDLFVAYSNADSGGTAGVALLTFTGGWTDVGPAPAPGWYAAAAPDGAGGAYVLGAGGSAALWRIAGADQLTFRALSTTTTYGSAAGVTVCGYLTGADGAPVAGVTVAVGTTAGGRFTPTASARTGADGFYRVRVAPTANATWTATVGARTGDEVVVRVAPKISLTLAHHKAGTRLSEIFTGFVSPDRAGGRVRVEKAVAGGWKTVAAGTLDARSHYRILWRLPQRTAIYTLRVVLPASTDYAEGTSPTATLRVKVRKG
jgi:hypothetical protein